MNVVSTAENGVVNKDTIFIFKQNDTFVEAEYAGGKIRKGFLVGQIKDDTLKFCFCQLQTDGSIDDGTSTCELAVGENGKIKLVENFEWASRPGEFGTNIFQEV